MTERCANCRFWIPPPEGRYGRSQLKDYTDEWTPHPTRGREYKWIPGSERNECRRHAAAVGATVPVATWPQTRPEDWCGEWEAPKTAQQLYDEAQGR